MKTLASFIVDHKGLFLIIFILLAVLGGLGTLFVPVNYNLADYIPDAAPSTQAIHLMEKEYQEPIPNLRVYVPNLSLQEALEMKKKVGEVSHIIKVLWLDDFYDLKTPLELAPKELVESYYKEGGALFMVVSGLQDTVGTLKEMQELIGEKGAIEGQVVDLAKARMSVDSEILVIMLIMIPMGLLLLCLATGSWIEPLLLLATITIGILLNMGTNVVFSSISFITQSVTAVLQLAVSMDYAVFLLHRFSAYRQEGMGLEEAMEKAIVKSSSAIVASASTTVLGFLALIFMRFKIGPDLGLVLAKGVIFSLISVIFVLPSLVLYSAKLIDKTTHRPLLPEFKRVGRFIVRIRYVVLLILLVVVPVFLAQNKNDFIYGAAAYDAGSREERDQELIIDKFGNQVTMAIMVPKGQWGKEKLLEEKLKDIPGVLGILSYNTKVGAMMPPELIDGELIKSLLSDNYSRLILTLRGPKEGKEAFRMVEEVRSAVDEFYGQEGHVVGESVVNLDMRDTVRKDNSIVNGLAILSVGLVLIINFRSLMIPLLLLLTIETSIWMNLSVPYFSGTTLSFIGYLVISTLQLGATVDYGILFTQHYLDNRKERGKKEAIYHSFVETIGGLLPPALILTAAGFILSYVSSLSIVSELGTVLGRGTLTSFLMVIFFLPGMLYVCDPLIEKTTWKAHFFKEKTKSNTSEQRGASE